MDKTESQSTTAWRLEQTYRTLPEAFYADAQAATFPQPRLLILNESLAQDLDLPVEAPASQWAAWVAGQTLPPGGVGTAQAYAGHQFGGFTMLGDGRAMLLGEQRDRSGQLWDIQLKGSGPTAFSRRGDGLAAVGPMVREYIIGEAMAGLGIPTSRGLAVVATGGPVYRETVLPGAVLARVAASHLRVGTFQYAAARGQSEAVTADLRALADYAIDRHYPDLAGEPDKYLKFYEAVLDRQASLIAAWQSVGFIHGVMNTDNVAISGETIDFGPCAFMDAYHASTVFSSIDYAGRYAYGNQPTIAGWNMARFAESLLALVASEPQAAVAAVTETLESFKPKYERYYLQRMAAKLGFPEASADEPGQPGRSKMHELVESLLGWMSATGADMTNTFRSLADSQWCEQTAAADEIFAAWHRSWLSTLAGLGLDAAAASDRMNRVNPRVIARNHRVEEAIAAASAGDIEPTHRLVELLRRPFDEHGDAPEFLEPAPAADIPYRTFCGT